MALYLFCSGDDSGSVSGANTQMVPQTCQELVWNSLGWPDTSLSLPWGIARLVGAQEEKELVGLQAPPQPRHSLHRGFSPHSLPWVMFNNNFNVPK